MVESYHSHKSDAIVIGAGLAGIKLTLELLDRGKSVLLFERDDYANIGGQAKESFGGIFMVDSPQQRLMGIKDAHELAYNDWCSFAQFDESDMLARNWARYYIEHCTNDIALGLKKYGVKFFPVVHWVERGLFTPGNSLPRFHMVWGTGEGLIKQLIQGMYNHPNKSKLTILDKHNVTDFIFTAGKVVGISGIDHNNHSFNAYAESTTVACGGIGANLDEVRRHWHQDWSTPPQKLLVGCCRYNDGQLHQRVQALGGKIENLDKMWNYAAGVPHPFPRRPNHGVSLVPTKSALWLNSKGKRIGPVPMVTGFDTRFLVQQVCRQEKQFSWQLMNYKIAVKELAVSGSEHNQAIRDRKLLPFLKTVLMGNKNLVNEFLKTSEHFVTAPTLDVLTDKMNAINEGDHIQYETIREEVRLYDEMIARGEKYFNDDQLRRIAHLRQYQGDKARTCRFQPINARNAGPLIAVKLNILVRKSLGGMTTNLKCQVLDRNDQAIQGLFAIGEAAGFGGGGIHGLRALEGTFLGNCIVNANVAARAIAAGH